MAMQLLEGHRGSLSAAALCAIVIACQGAIDPDPLGTAGSNAGGLQGVSGAPSSGGVANGGSPSLASGGTSSAGTSSGGAPRGGAPSGGAAPAGGNGGTAVATGGRSNSGGVGGKSGGGIGGGAGRTSGGAVGTGGTTSSGGRGSGGRTSRGGSTGTGGSTGLGGAAATGGSKATTGGSASAGASSGGSGSCVQNLSCKLSALPSTGDIHQDCVDRVNQFRTQCACLPALARWTDGEECADRMAEYDSVQGTAHAGFSSNLCNGGTAQDECPGYGSEAQVISGCLQQMWDEGPPPQTPCTGTCYQEHGHFINMTGNTTRVACGFYTMSSGKVWSVQNFSR